MQRSETHSKSCKQMKQKRIDFFRIKKKKINLPSSFFVYFQVCENTAYVQTALSSFMCLVSIKPIRIWLSKIANLLLPEGFQMEDAE